MVGAGQILRNKTLFTHKKVSSQWNITTEKQHFKKAFVYEEGCCNNSMQQSLKTIITYFVRKEDSMRITITLDHFFPGRADMKMT